MRILYDDSFTKEDRVTYKKFINVNIILSMRSLLVGMGRKEMGVEIHPDHAQILESLISQSSMLDQVFFLHSILGEVLIIFFMKNITPDLAAGIKKLWSDQTVKKFFREHHCQFQVCGRDHFSGKREADSLFIRSWTPRTTFSII